MYHSTTYTGISCLQIEMFQCHLFLPNTGTDSDTWTLHTVSAHYDYTINQNTVQKNGLLYIMAWCNIQIMEAPIYLWWETRKLILFSRWMKSHHFFSSAKTKIVVCNNYHCHSSWIVKFFQSFFKQNYKTFAASSFSTGRICCFFFDNENNW